MPRLVCLVLLTLFLDLSHPLFATEPLSDVQLRQRADVYARLFIDTLSTTNRDGVIYTPERLAFMLSQLFAEFQQTVPKDIQKSILERKGSIVTAFSEAMYRLGNQPGLTLGRALVVTLNQLRSDTDPYSGLVFQNTFVASPAGLPLGIELEGLTLNDRIAYHIDSLNLDGLNEARLPKPPVGPLWVVSRVLPGSTAAQLGVTPGDRITQIDGIEVTQSTYTELFAKLLMSRPRTAFEFDLPDAEKQQIKFQFAKPDDQRPLTLSYTGEPYMATVFHAPRRAKTGEPYFWLDENYKIACIRISAIEQGAEQDFLSILEELRQEEIQGLILDLRWCPGGYVTPTNAILSQFLPAGSELSRLQPVQQGPVQNFTQPERSFGSYHPFWLKVPLAVLVNGQTVGGGEMIAAALQDHRRAIVMGQRTFGKANIMIANPIMIPGLSFRVTTGYSIRPNGKMRHRMPNARLEDPWGVKPTPGYEIPTTLELSKQYLQQAEAFAIRPATDRQVLEADDPQSDAQRWLALKLFLRHLSEKESSKTP